LLLTAGADLQPPKIGMLEGKVLADKAHAVTDRAVGIAGQVGTGRLSAR
jgi:hypothetical protein